MKHAARMKRVSALLVVLVAVAGCGGGPPAARSTPAAAASAADPGAVLGPMPTTGAGPAEHARAATFESCKVLTRADLERAFRQPYRDAEPTLDENSSVLSSVTNVNHGCTYWATERRAAGVGEVDLDLAHLPDAAGTYASIRGRYLTVPSFADVPGIGDAAFRSGGMLMVRKGGTILDLGVNETGDAIQLPRLTTVARIALTRV